MANIRVLGRVLIGFAVVATGYMCVDMLSGKPKGLAAHRPTDRPSPETARVTDLREQVRVHVEAAHVAPAASAAQALPAQHPAPDRSAELQATLEAQYAIDPLPTRDSLERERVLSQLFSNPELQGKGELQEVSCKQSICRGVIKMASEAVDNEVFGRTFLSPEFDRAVPDAFSVASREKARDGSIRATFYIHPQGIFEQLTPLPE